MRTFVNDQPQINLFVIGQKLWAIINSIVQCMCNYACSLFHCSLALISRPIQIRLDPFYIRIFFDLNYSIAMLKCSEHANAIRLYQSKPPSPIHSSSFDFIFVSHIFIYISYAFFKDRWLYKYRWALFIRPCSMTKTHFIRSRFSNSNMGIKHISVENVFLN